MPIYYKFNPCQPGSKHQTAGDKDISSITHGDIEQNCK